MPIINTEVSVATLDDKPLLQRLVELYQYDFSEIQGGDLDQHGCFGYLYLDNYWVDADRYPFLVRVNGKLAGFVLVNRLTYWIDNQLSLAEFFILRKYRRQGIGKVVAFQVFDKFHGKWEIRETAANVSAQCFWRKVVAEYTAGQYIDILFDDEKWKGPAQFFNNASRNAL